MLKKLSAPLIGISCFLGPAQAAPCVKVRNGNDGYRCMKFSAEDRRKASEYGLRLAAPYAEIKQHLVKNGWSIDQKWIDENSTGNPTKDGLVCGNGWDAECSTAFRKNQKTISLILSGSNEGFPLIGIDMEPAP
jgi:hypothetical protein